MATPLEIEGMLKNDAAAAYRTKLDGAFVEYGFGPQTLDNLRVKHCLPFLHGKWETPEQAATFPPTLSGIIERVATENLYVGEVNLSYDYAHVLVRPVRAESPQADARILLKAEDGETDIEVSPWLLFDINTQDLHAHQLAVNGQFPGTYDPTRNVRLDLSVDNLRELSQVVDMAVKAPVSWAISAPTHPFYYPDMEEAVRHGIEIKAE